MRHYLYSIDSCVKTENPSEITPQLPAGYHYEIWDPSLFCLRPEGTPGYFIVWWIFHYARIFRNNDFCVFLVKNGSSLAHYSIVSPDYYRFPFMAHIDLTIGDSFTFPTHRRKGLYTFVLAKSAEVFQKPGRAIWTIHDEGNDASKGSFLKAGYKYVGEVVRTKPFGIRLLGQYKLSDQDC